MRKFIYAQILDPLTFDLALTIVEKDENGNTTVLLKEPVKRHPLPNRYTKEEIEQIEKVNSVLSDRGEAPMTEEEMEYFVDPMGLTRLEKKTPDPEDIQKLAGFKVEKKIVSV